MISGSMTANYAALHAAGVPGYATGTDYAPGGVSLVGEKGPELVRLPTGSQVLNAEKTKSALGGRTGPTLHIENYHAGSAPLSELADALAWRMR